MLLRLEALGLLFGACAVYQVAHLSWGIFAAIFLIPDLSILGYLANARVGAVTYNFAHTALVYAPLVGLGFFSGAPNVLMVGLIGLAHIGFDWLLGNGLKAPTSFGDTHLRRKGSAKQER